MRWTRGAYFAIVLQSSSRGIRLCEQRISSKKTRSTAETHQTECRLLRLLHQLSWEQADDGKDGVKVPPENGEGGIRQCAACAGKSGNRTSPAGRLIDSLEKLRGGLRVAENRESLLHVLFVGCKNGVRCRSFLEGLVGLDAIFRRSAKYKNAVAQTRLAAERVARIVRQRGLGHCEGWTY